MIAELAVDDALLVLCPPPEPIEEEFKDCVLLVPWELLLLRALGGRSMGPLLSP